MIIGAVIAYVFCGSLAETVVPKTTYEVFLEKSQDWNKTIANYDETKQHLLGITKGELTTMVARGTIAPETPTFLSGLATPQPAVSIVGVQHFTWIEPWTIICGVIGISALLLPGVSGSYILNILGMYPILIGALAELVNGFKNLEFDFDAFLILLNFGAGVVVGALVFSRAIGWCLKHYHQTTLSLLTGFLIGSMESVWPFWTHEYLLNPLKIESGPKLHALEPMLPTGNYEVIGISIILVVAGFIAVFALESVANRLKDPVQNLNLNLGKKKQD
jgi:putative membrane protein